MARPSAVETHPQFDAIRQAILDQQQPDEVIAQSVSPPISQWAVLHYRRKLFPTSATVTSVVESIPCIDKMWVQNGYVQIYERAMEGKSPDLGCARATLDSISRLNGYDAPKRSESVSVSLRGIAPAQISEHIREMLSSLPDSAKQQLLSDPDIKTIETEAE